MSTFTRFVALPKGMKASTLAPCLLSLGKSIQKLYETPVVGMKIDTVERKLVITFKGEDPQPQEDRKFGFKNVKKRK